jgi:hypothetical protein
MRRPNDGLHGHTPLESAPPGGAKTTGFPDQSNESNTSTNSNSVPDPSYGYKNDPPHVYILIPSTQTDQTYDIPNNIRTTPIKYNDSPSINITTDLTKIYNNGTSHNSENLSCPLPSIPKLPVCRTDHPMDTDINTADIIQICQAMLPTSTNMLHTQDGRKYDNITKKNFIDLLSHGQPISDSIIHEYLSILCTNHDIYFLDTNFYPDLCNHGWHYALHKYMLHSNSRRTSTRSKCKPKPYGDHTILIPIHVHGNHWVALARKQVKDSIKFYYADDLNLIQTQQLIHNHFANICHNTEFYPLNAEWIHINTPTYHPHSNECGPRTLLALTIMGLHNNPHKNMMSPLMHSNIAQITRTWIAKILVTHFFNTTPFLPTLTSPPCITFTHNNNHQSHPHNLFDLHNIYNTHSANQPGILSSPAILQRNLNETDQTHHYNTPIPKYNNNALTTSHTMLHAEKVPQKSPHPNTKHTTNQLQNSQLLIEHHNAPHTKPDQCLKNLLPPSQCTQCPLLSPTRQPGTSNDTPPIISQTDSTISQPTINEPQQKSITQWTKHREIPGKSATATPLTPFGTPLTTIDPTKTFRCILQNPQYSTQLSYNNNELMEAIHNLKNLQASMFAISSPNINWHNPSHWVQFKRNFQSQYQQVHISATSSDIGKEPNYINRPLLIGGAAILTFNQWASKVHHTQTDERGHGTFCVTTILGRNGRKISFICAYISVLKGTTKGENTVYAQQMTLMEQHAYKANRVLPLGICPRKEAIKALSTLLGTLQEQDHAIILLLDANQTPRECHTSQNIKKHSIEWLKMEHGLDDPFIELCGQRPPTTTLHPGRDIDYILTWGINATGITTLEVNTPAQSDHYGICIDIDISRLFQGKYGELSLTPARQLTTKNVRAKNSYIQYIKEQWATHKLYTKAQDLYNNAGHITRTKESAKHLQNIDEQVSTTLLNGEYQCSKGHKQRNHWSPALQRAGRILSYWKKKMQMSRRHHFIWYILDKKRQNTNISDLDHESTDISLIKQNLTQARITWKQTKAQSADLRKQFLTAQAEDKAARQNITTEQALNSIMNAEESRRTYQQIRELVGHKKTETH